MSTEQLLKLFCTDPDMNVEVLKNGVVCDGTATFRVGDEISVRLKDRTTVAQKEDDPSRGGEPPLEGVAERRLDKPEVAGSKPARGTTSRRVYVASSWRNTLQPDVVARLRAAGHEVYDFHEPSPGQHGFAWREVSPSSADTIAAYFEAIGTGRAREGFELDKKALDWCDTCVLVLPCGRSAHLEAGYAAGQGKDVYFLLTPQGFEPELMYLLGTGCATTLEDILDRMARRPSGSVARFHSAMGGHFARPASHALRLLREVVELCVAAGASQNELLTVVHQEVIKEYSRDAFASNMDKVPEEWADCALLLEVFRSYAGIDAQMVVRKKLDVCWEREWHPDEGGALYRPRPETTIAEIVGDLYDHFLNGNSGGLASGGFVDPSDPPVLVGEGHSHGRVVGRSPLLAAPYTAAGVPNDSGGFVVTTSGERGEVPKVVEASFCWMHSSSGRRRVVFSVTPPKHCIHGKAIDTKCDDCKQYHDRYGEPNRDGFDPEQRAQGFESKLDTER